MPRPSITIARGDISAAPFTPIACTNAWPGTDRAVEARFAASYDDAALHLRFITDKAPLLCRNFADQTPVSRDSCVEAFLQPAPGGEYWNFEFNMAGMLNASHRLTRPEPTRLGAPELAMVRRRATPGAQAPVDVPGNDSAWELTVDIPWALMKLRPEKGTALRGNFYACASDAKPPYYLSWAPIDTHKPDFHRPEFFGDIILG